MTFPTYWLALATVFIAVAAGTGLVLVVVLSRFSPERRRLAQVAGARRDAVPLEAMLLDPSSQPASWSRYVGKSAKDVSRLRRRLASAGYERAPAAMVFAISELAMPVIVAAVPLIVLGPRRGLLLAVIGAAIGFLLPGLWLDQAGRKRRLRIRNGLPDALDLLIVCVEAGNGLDQAIVKASEELRVSHPDVANELRMINLETRAGKPRLDAFRNFADRTRVDDVRSLVSMLVQTDRFGTSVAQAMRTFADVLRTKRRQRAEEKAAKLGVKLVIPLVFFLFPALYVVTLGPAVVQYVRVFKAHVDQRMK